MEKRTQRLARALDVAIGTNASIALRMWLGPSTQKEVPDQGTTRPLGSAIASITVELVSFVIWRRWLARQIAAKQAEPTPAGLRKRNRPGIRPRPVRF